MTDAGTPPDAAVPAGFLGALFDMSFSSFITTKIIKLLYALGMLVAGLAALAVVLGGFAQGAGTGLLALIVLAPLVFFGMVIYFRVMMELIIVVFRVAEHLVELTSQAKRASAGR